MSSFRQPRSLFTLFTPAITELVRTAMPLVAFCLWLACAATARAQTGYSITGSMSNFDCGNHCDEPCDEFEVEIEDCQPGQIVHTYHNSNYGSPTVTPGASGTSTIVDYRNPQHLTAVGAIEHFGISMQQITATNTIRVRWMRNGHTATVNGQVPTPGGGSAPATQPMLPSITAEMSTGSGGGDGVACSVTNNDPVQSIWIKRRALVSQGAVTLEQLMPNDPVVTTTVALDSSPILLGAGQTISVVNDLVEVEDNESVVFAAEYQQDLTQNGPFNSTHVPGPVLGNVMTASIASPDSGCSYSSPIIYVQPSDVTADEGREVALQVGADGNDLTLSYQWLKEGQPLTNSNGFHGVTTDELSIDSLTAATEGFYAVRVSNTCGAVVSDSALVFITGHNQPPLHPCEAATVAPVSDQMLCAFGFTTIAAAASGSTPIAYQWQVETDPDTWIAIDPAGTALPCGGLIFAMAPDAAMTDVALVPCDGMVNYRVRCAVSNTCGNATSAAATLSVLGAIPGDLNADGLVDGGDIQPFVDTAMAGGGGPAACAGDMNFDAIVDAADVQMFIDVLLSQ